MKSAVLAIACFCCLFATQPAVAQPTADQIFQAVLNWGSPNFDINQFIQLIQGTFQFPTPTPTQPNDPTATPTEVLQPTPTPTQGNTGHPFRNIGWNVLVQGITALPFQTGAIIVTDSEGNLEGIAALGLTPQLAGTRWLGTIQENGAISGVIRPTMNFGNQQLGTFSGTASGSPPIFNWTGTWSVSGVGSGAANGAGTRAQ